MLGWPEGLPPFEDLKSLFAGVVGIAGACYMAWLGATRGKPTSATAIEAVAANACGAAALSLDISALKKGQADIQTMSRDLHRENAEMQKDITHVRDAVNRIEAMVRAR